MWKAALKDNTNNIVKTAFFCACFLFCVKVLGYDPNVIGLGGLIGLLTPTLGDIADHWVNGK